ncbi:MAG: putative colanic acid biosynthesis acetyltransferase [Nitrospirota bacterium]|jgi:putative colanic acid biosynthesis acetyltransferase WcaF
MSDNHMLDVAQNRQAKKYTVDEMTRRVLWTLARPLFRFSPRPCFGWRRFLLRCFGAKIGRSVHVYSSATVYFPWNLEVGDESAIGEQVFIYNLGRVTLGSRVTISHRAHLCAGTHDHTKPDFPLLRPPIVIGSDAWICADAFVGPGVTVGEGAIVGARAVAIKDVKPRAIVVGNPARESKNRATAQ